VPWVEDKDLEPQRRSGNDEIGQGDSTREYHGREQGAGLDWIQTVSRWDLCCYSVRSV
jgi:hypothetical protein